MNPGQTSEDYETSLRRRQLEAEKEAAELRLKVRAVARELGGRFRDEVPEHDEIDLGPTVQLWARRDWNNKEMIKWGARCPLVPHVSVPSICTAVRRPVAAMAADVARRLVPVAREKFKGAVAEAGRARDLEHARGARVAELAQVLGRLECSHDKTHHVDGFAIHHNELLPGHDRRMRAEVRVHSWHCLLMIARLVAEDARLHPRPKDE